MLVEPEYCHIMLHRKTAGGTWETETYRKCTEVVDLQALGIKMPLAEVYHGLAAD